MIAPSNFSWKWMLGLFMMLMVAAGLIYAYKNYVSWEYKPMSIEDRERFQDRYIYQLSSQADMSFTEADMSTLDQDWPVFVKPHPVCEYDEPDHISRSIDNPYSATAKVCRHWTSADGYVSTMGWEWEIVEP